MLTFIIVVFCIVYVFRKIGAYIQNNPQQAMQAVQLLRLLFTRR